MAGRHFAAEQSQDAHDFPHEPFGGKPDPDIDLVSFWMRLHALHVMELPDLLRHRRLRTLGAHAAKK
jgi:hypothetical protein